MDKYQESNQGQGKEFLVDIAFGKLPGYFISSSKGVDLSVPSAQRVYGSGLWQQLFYNDGEMYVQIQFDTELSVFVIRKKEQGYFAVEVCEAISELLLCFVICEGGECQESGMQQCNHW